MKRFLLAPIAGVFVLAAAAPVFGQWGTSSEMRRAAYDNGFREGVKEGEKDGRQRDRFEYRDEGDFQRGDVGYHRTYGDVERYRQSFRAGFADGYGQGFGRYNRGYGYGNGGYSYGGYRNYSPGFDNGIRVGYEKGREDVRDRDPFEPRRHQWYRAGDRHYRSEYGSRQRYEDDYRRGFMSGYEQGYAEGRYRAP
jgi:hypothetical protein